MKLHYLSIILSLYFFELHVDSYSFKTNLNLVINSRYKSFSYLKSNVLLANANDKESDEVIKKSISNIDKNRLNGQGEWEDWENESHIDDEYTMDDDEDDSNPMASSSLLQMMKESMISQNGNLVMSLMNKIEDKATYSNDKVIRKETDAIIENVIQVVNINTKASSDITNKIHDGVSTSSSSKAPEARDADYWKGWSEEAPYFDEYDVQDDEGNWGRSDESLENDSKGFQSSSISGSSDLWNRHSPIVDSDTIPTSTSDTTHTSSSSIDSSSSSSTSSTTNNANNEVVNLKEEVSTMLSHSESLLLLIQMQELERRIDNKLTYITMTLDTLKSTATSSSIVDSNKSETRLILPNLSTIIVYMLMFSCIQHIVNSILSKL